MWIYAVVFKGTFSFEIIKMEEESKKQINILGQFHTDASVLLKCIIWWRHVFTSQTAKAISKAVKGLIYLVSNPCSCWRCLCLDNA